MSIHFEWASIMISRAQHHNLAIWPQCDRCGVGSTAYLATPRAELVLLVVTSEPTGIWCTSGLCALSPHQAPATTRNSERNSSNALFLDVLHGVRPVLCSEAVSKPLVNWDMRVATNCGCGCRCINRAKVSGRKADS